MPLRDHFYPPLSQMRPWESLHALWASEITRTLNRRVLPAECFAAAQVHVGSRVEVDIGTFHDERPVVTEGSGGGGVAVATWAPPTTALVMPAVFPDEIEVQVFRESGGAVLVAAIELVSPGNKDRPETRRAFAAKCAAYLQQGVGLVVVDIVSSRLANLHNELVRLMGQADTFAMPDEPALYAVSYRPSRQRDDRDQIELWPAALTVGQALPIMPLALRGLATLPLDLETTYTSTCQDMRL